MQLRFTLCGKYGFDALSPKANCITAIAGIFKESRKSQARFERSPKSSATNRVFGKCFFKKAKKSAPAPIFHEPLRASFVFAGIDQ